MLKCQYCGSSRHESEKCILYRKIKNPPARPSWKSVKATWKKADSFVKSMLSRVTGGKVDKKIRSLRILSCHGVDENGIQVDSPCEYRKYSKKMKYHFCGACGCGENHLARLSEYESTENTPIFSDQYIKLDYPFLKCPLNKPGFSKDEDTTSK